MNPRRRQFRAAPGDAAEMYPTRTPEPLIVPPVSAVVLCVTLPVVPDHVVSVAVYRVDGRLTGVVSGCGTNLALHVMDAVPAPYTSAKRLILVPTGSPTTVF